MMLKEMCDVNAIHGRTSEFPITYTVFLAK
jgi:hypothetical protein